MNNRIFNLSNLIILIPFIFIFIIEYLTPMQSDDFVYYIKGNSIAVHLNHYFSWSGRFVSDYFSTLLLSTDSQILKSTTIAIIVTILLFLITKIGNSLNKSNRYFNLQFLTLFFIYWITIPNIGQIVFWIVGAANYLLTNLFVVTFIYALIRYFKERKGITLLLLVSFFAGCSNENTTWIVLLTSLITSSFLYYKEKNKILFLSTLLVFIGFSVLIFSPGNLNRAALSTEFYELSLVSKIWLFLSDKLPYALSKTWIPILVSLVLLTSYIKNKKCNNFYLSLLFIILGLLSTLSMVVSPTFPTRALSGPHLFYIISCSFSISHILNTKNKSIISLSTLSVISTLSLVSFIYSYSQIVFSYNSVNAQQKIRKYQISKSIIENQKIDKIPNFYYPKSLRAGDSIDLYNDPNATGKYYNLSNSVNVYPINYNYSVIINGKKIPLPDSENTGISNIYIGKDTLLRDTSIAIEFDSVNKFTPDTKFIVKTKNGKYYEYKNLKADTLYGMNVVGFIIPVVPSDIYSISYKIYNETDVTIKI
ncbi:DUF6056 family protein [Providencia rettgeri]|uniref:DUF6056 family protein n=2 Tax=Morganellaceae TaxID=1903414 RepID=UPI00155EE5D1|nr:MULTISPECIES: DUF6056 family protein [Providencia]MBQ0528494.1 hypothetical protein [Providencia rettgeri]QKG44331.1 hypothetical protein HRD55_06885 [Providencia rettgeri]QNN34463.1 hypothetical protein H9X60_06890 [Providencia rettgeri]WOB87777.1 DUF6056 family protein [Providencia sp. PROV040]